jgi:hypothetical protein
VTLSSSIASTIIFAPTVVTVSMVIRADEKVFSAHDLQDQHDRHCVYLQRWCINSAPTRRVIAHARTQKYQRGALPSAGVRWPSLARSSTLADCISARTRELRERPLPHRSPRPWRDAKPTSADVPGPRDPREPFQPTCWHCAVAQLYCGAMYAIACVVSGCGIAVKARSEPCESTIQFVRHVNCT